VLPASSSQQAMCNRLLAFKGQDTSAASGSGTSAMGATRPNSSPRTGGQHAQASRRA